MVLAVTDSPSRELVELLKKLILTTSLTAATILVVKVEDEFLACD